MEKTSLPCQFHRNKIILSYPNRPDKHPDPDISPMMKAKDKPYFADTLPFLMLSRWFDDENSRSSCLKMS